MRFIKISTDYQCYPLWEASLGNFGNISPNDLPISKELCKALTDWATVYDKTLKIDNPTQSGFKSLEDAQNFQKVGSDLAIQLNLELGGNYKIILGPVFCKAIDLVATAKDF